MPSNRFADFDRTVAIFMRDFGFIATYIRTTSTPNDATGGVDEVIEEIPVQAIKMELVRPMEGVGTKTGTQIQTGDQILYIRPTEKVDPLATPLTINPASDSIRINGVIWNVVTVKEYNTDYANNIVFEIYIRK